MIFPNINNLFLFGDQLQGRNILQILHHISQLFWAINFDKTTFDHFDNLSLLRQLFEIYFGMHRGRPVGECWYAVRHQLQFIHLCVLARALSGNLMSQWVIATSILHCPPPVCPQRWRYLVKCLTHEHNKPALRLLFLTSLFVLRANRKPVNAIFKVFWHNSTGELNLGLQTAKQTL